MATTKVMGLTASIYRTKSYPGSRNVMGNVEEVTIVGVGCDGKPVAPVFEPTGKAPAVRLVFRQLGRETYVHAEPTNIPAGSGKFGGTIIHTSDSRFGEATGVSYPIKLHDHVETAQQARDNSI